MFANKVEFGLRLSPAITPHMLMPFLLVTCPGRLAYHLTKTWLFEWPARAALHSCSSVPHVHAALLGERRQDSARLSIGGWPRPPLEQEISHEHWTSDSATQTLISMQHAVDLHFKVLVKAI